MGKTLDQAAVLEMARIIGAHQGVKVDGQVGKRCRHIDCKDLIMLTLNDQYRHIAVILNADGFGDEQKAKQEVLDEVATDLESHAVENGQGQFVFPGEDTEEPYYRASGVTVSASDWIRVKSSEFYPEVYAYNYEG